MIKKEKINCLKKSQIEIWEKLKWSSAKQGLSERKLFKEADANREKRTRILRTLARDLKAIKRPILSKYQKESVIWAMKYMKTYFSVVTFNDECRSNLNVVDRWA